MDCENFDLFCSNAQGQGVIFFYDGDFSETIISALAESVRTRLSEVDVGKDVIKRIFSSFIELVMNILHYSPRGEGDPRGVVIVGHSGERYFIATGNYMLAEHVERLRNKIEPVTRMTSEEIRKAYRTQLRNTEPEADGISKGAGLGLLTIARDAAEPFQYSFNEVPDQPHLSHFFLKVLF